MNDNTLPWIKKRVPIPLSDGDRVIFECPYCHRIELTEYDHCPYCNKTIAIKILGEKNG